MCLCAPSSHFQHDRQPTGRTSPASYGSRVGVMVDGVVGLPSSPCHLQPCCRNNVLALIRTVSTLFPTALCSAGSKLASHGNLWITVEHGSAAVIQLYTVATSSVLNSSASAAFFSLCFLPHAVSSQSPPTLPPTGSERRFICKRQQNNKATLAPSITSSCSSSLPKPFATCLKPSYAPYNPVL